MSLLHRGSVMISLAVKKLASSLLSKNGGWAYGVLGEKPAQPTGCGPVRRTRPQMYMPDPNTPGVQTYAHGGNPKKMWRPSIWHLTVRSLPAHVP